MALRHLGLSRIATVTPYTNDLTAGLTTFLAEADIEVVATAGLGPDRTDLGGPVQTPSNSSAASTTNDAEAVFISCTNLPTYDVIAGLEATIGKPVLTANQVTIWSALALAGRLGTGPGQSLLAAQQPHEA